ncbi:MAG: hypothetical protein DMG85_02615 [Acidobacteria bacterium]|nr:MAG: hypothetical protein DMG85_02615 [Acidobacteriota bacterium]
MARRHITVPVFFILMLAAGCPSLTPAKELRTVSVQRTACYGTCPVYSVSIHGSGLVEYSEERYVDVPGPETGRIPSDRGSLEKLRASTKQEPVLGPDTLTSASAEWQVLAQDKFITAWVERRLYRRPEDTVSFFVHVRIYSNVGRKLSIDLRDRYKLFYPNQWTPHLRPARDLIDEHRITPANLSPELRSRLVADFHAGALIPVGAHLDYYREFFGKGPENKELLGAHFLVVSMDGQLFLSDGEVVDTLSLQWENGKGPKDTDLVVPLPIEWILLPKEAKVFKE